MYPEPDSFRPEQFLKPDGSVRDGPVLTSVFGFGKRVCPGGHFVDSLLFIIVITSSLSVFDIEKGKNTNGGPDVFQYTGAALSLRYSLASRWWCEGIHGELADCFLISRPHSFHFSIIPRDKRAEELIVADTLIR